MKPAMKLAFATALALGMSVVTAPARAENGSSDALRMMGALLGVAAGISADNTEGREYRTSQAPRRSLRPKTRPYGLDGRAGSRNDLQEFRGTPGTLRGRLEPNNPRDYNLPSACVSFLPMTHNGNKGMFYLTEQCLTNYQEALDILPRDCKIDLSADNGGRSIYAAPCLLNRGFVFGY